MMRNKRKTVYVSEPMEEIIRGHAERLSISESAFLNMCANEYDKQYRAMQIMTDMSALQELVTRLEKLEQQCQKA